MEHLSHFFHSLVVHFGYLGLFVVIFLGNMGMPIGIEVVMPAAGALAATGHLPSLGHRYGKYVRFREHELDRVHAFYEKHGRSMVFWCRFIPFIRGLAALPPGLSHMPKRYFLTYTAMGSAIFCFGLAFLGDAAGHNVDGITSYVHDFALAISIGLVVVLAIAAIVWRVRSSRRAAVTPRPE
jgi:membrane protein DedA with SNARE-associated domain